MSKTIISAIAHGNAVLASASKLAQEMNAKNFLKTNEYNNVYDGIRKISDHLGIIRGPTSV